MKEPMTSGVPLSRSTRVPPARRRVRVSEQPLDAEKTRPLAATYADVCFENCSRPGSQPQPLVRYPGICVPHTFRRHSTTIAPTLSLRFSATRF